MLNLLYRCEFVSAFRELHAHDLVNLKVQQTSCSDDVKPKQSNVMQDLIAASIRLEQSKACIYPNAMLYIAAFIVSLGATLLLVSQSTHGSY